MEEKRPGEYFPVYENERGTYIFNSKDLCMIEYLPELVAAGIDSLKIEGRMKTALYVATVARTYRKAIDDYFTSEELYRQNMDWYRAEIVKCTTRKFTTGFYFGKPNEESQIYDNNTYTSDAIYLGIVEGVEGDLAQFEQRNKFSVGEEIEIMKPSGESLKVQVEALYTLDGEAVESCPHSKQKLMVKLSQTPELYDLLRKENQ
jgi:putative protease